MNEQIFRHAYIIMIISMKKNNYIQSSDTLKILHKIVLKSVSLKNNFFATKFS